MSDTIGIIAASVVGVMMLLAVWFSGKHAGREAQKQEAMREKNLAWLAGSVEMVVPLRDVRFVSFSYERDKINVTLNRADNIEFHYKSDVKAAASVTTLTGVTRD